MVYRVPSFNSVNININNIDCELISVLFQLVFLKIYLKIVTTMNKFRKYMKLECLECGSTFDDDYRKKTRGKMPIK